MTVEDSRPRSASKSIETMTATSVGRFYERRHQLYGALDQYSKALLSNPDNTATYIDRSRLFLKMGSINKAQEDTNLALSLIDDKQKHSNLLYYYVCLQNAEVLYADGEFELGEVKYKALVYFHRANKVKPAQQICIEGIQKTTEILQCTICNPMTHLTMPNNLIDNQDNENNIRNLLNRPPIRKELPSNDLPLTEYTNKEANRLLAEVAKDRRLLINLFHDKQPSAGFTGLDKAKIEAQQAVSIIETELKFLDRAECVHVNDDLKLDNLKCTSYIDQTRAAEQELAYIQTLSPKDKSVEILYRTMKIIHCFTSTSMNSGSTLDTRSRLILAEAYRLIGQASDELKLYEQSLENYKQAYEILLPLNDQYCFYRALFDIAMSLMLAKNYMQAIVRFTDMLDKATSDNERAFVHQYISLAYLNLNDYDQAKKNAFECLDYAFKSHEELLHIEANILLGKIHFRLEDFQRAEEYINYARNLKDQLGDLHQMKYLDELIHNIKGHKQNIFHDKLSPLIQYAEKYSNKIHQQQTSSIVEPDENREIHSLKNSFTEKTLHHWRLLTPYYRLFENCVERKKKNRPNMDYSKQTMTVVAASSPSLPLISTANDLIKNSEK